MANSVMATSGFINLEFSRGKWNGDDVRALEEPLLMVVSRAGALDYSVTNLTTG